MRHHLPYSQLFHSYFLIRIPPHNLDNKNPQLVNYSHNEQSFLYRNSNLHIKSFILYQNSSFMYCFLYLFCFSPSSYCHFIVILISLFIAYPLFCYYSYFLRITFIIFSHFIVHCQIHFLPLHCCFHQNIILKSFLNLFNIIF